MAEIAMQNISDKAISQYAENFRSVSMIEKNISEWEAYQENFEDLESEEEKGYWTGPYTNFMNDRLIPAYEEVISKLTSEVVDLKDINKMSLSNLKKLLKKALDNDEFEKAATIRDLITSKSKK